MNIRKSFASNYMTKLATILMLDKDISKLLYYTDVSDKDIFSLDDLKNPIHMLYEKRVFIDRKLDKLISDAEIGLFINIDEDSPYKKVNQSSRFFNELQIEIGIICHKKCRDTLNGIREVLIANRIKEIVATHEELQGIGENEVISNEPMFSIPYYDFNGYAVVFKLQYWRE